MYKYYYLYNEDGIFIKEVLNYNELKTYLLSFGSISDLSRAIKHGYKVANHYVSDTYVDKYFSVHKKRKNAS